MTLKINPPSLQVPADFAGNPKYGPFFNGLINTIYQLWTAVYNQRVKSKITTTDGAVTGLLRVGIPSGRTMMIQAYIVARRTSGSGSDGDSAFYVLTGAYKNVGGTLTGIGTPNLVSGEDVSGWDVAFTNSGEEAVITVTGASGTNITWEGTVSTYLVGA